MPYGDGTGPDGYGPRTGRGAGFCGGYNVPGFMNNAVPRLGIGRRFFGRIFYGDRGFYRRGFYYYPYYGHNAGIISAYNTNLSKEEQVKVLEEELKEIELKKERIENILKALK
ncbi:MAG: DUF5320 domain-containing protein [Thermoplasmata archaeon]